MLALLAQVATTVAPGAAGPGSDTNASGQANSLVGLLVLLLLGVVIVVGAVLVARSARAARSRRAAG
ncbi:MAG: hypothetical protein U0Q07_14165 [Acidimicrobiales bacterium]